MAKTTNKDKTEIVAADNTALANPSSNEFVIDTEDINIPRLSVIQKMSTSDFDHGSLVIDKAHEIISRETKISCVILGATKKWKEDIDFDSDEMPIIVGTKGEADVLKRESDYPILEFAELYLMFAQPEGNDDDDAFPYPIGDNNYCIGKLYVQKDAYRKTYKSLMTFAAFNRGMALGSRLWNFESQIMSKGKYSWYVPSLTVTKEQVPEAVAAFSESFSI